MPAILVPAWAPHYAPALGFLVKMGYWEEGEGPGTWARKRKRTILGLGRDGGRRRTDGRAQVVQLQPKKRANQARCIDNRWVHDIRRVITAWSSVVGRDHRSTLAFPCNHLALLENRVTYSSQGQLRSKIKPLSEVGYRDHNLVASSKTKWFIGLARGSSTTEKAMQGTCAKSKVLAACSSQSQPLTSSSCGEREGIMKFGLPACLINAPALRS